MRRFVKGETIELSPVFILKDPTEKLPGEFRRRVFKWSNTPYSAIALGYGSLYNHSDKPNVEYKSNMERMVMEFIALRDIDPREELTISYESATGEHKDVEKSWFERHGVEKHES